jgi:hypothetical protein
MEKQLIHEIPPEANQTIHPRHFFKILTMQVFCHVPSHTSLNQGLQEYGMTASLMLGGNKSGRRHLSQPKGTGGGETIF